MKLKEQSMPKMNGFDMIRVHVHDDGDTELQKHFFSTGLTTLYPGDLFYDVRDITKGRLDGELQSYGTDPEVAKRCIDEVITAEYGVIVEVK
jgi:hypothetical protein